VAAVSDTPLALVLQAREEEVAATDGGGEIAVGADLRAVERGGSIIVGVHHAQEAPEERGRRMGGAEPAEEIAGGGQASPPRAGEGGAGERGEGREAEEDAPRTSSAIDSIEVCGDVGGCVSWSRLRWRLDSILLFARARALGLGIGRAAEDRELGGCALTRVN
jgi:hypothetical protein